MNDFNNLYLIFIIVGIIILTYNFVKPKKEPFVGRLLRPLRAMANLATSLPSILGMLTEAAINFFFNFIDMFIALFEALEWLGNVVPNFIDASAYVVTIFSDLLLLITLWLNPITMIKSIIKLVFFLVKLIFNTIFSIIKTLGSHFGDKFVDGIRGSLWGIPHGPEQHIEHSRAGATGNISRTDLGIHGHHHAGDLSKGEDINLDQEGNVIEEDSQWSSYKSSGSNKDAWNSLGNNFPQAKKMLDSSLCLPMFTDIKKIELNYIIKSFKRIVC